MFMQIEFPSETVILSYTKKCSESKELTSVQRKIITTVAKKFANQTTFIKNLREEIVIEILKLNPNSEDINRNVYETLVNTLLLSGEIFKAKL